MYEEKDIISEYDLNQVWGNADFGSNKNKRLIIKHALLKCAAGYFTGYTIRQIIVELGLATDRCELTPKGKLYLFTAFSNGISL